MPSVINNQVFIDHYTENCQNIKNQSAQSALNAVNSINLLPLLKSEADHVDNFLKSLCTDQRFEVGNGPNFTKLRTQGKKKAGYNVVKDCFKDTQRRELVAFFAGLIAPFISFWILARAQRLHIANFNIDANLINDYNSLGPTVMVKSAINKRKQFFKNNIETMCLRLCSDWNDINELFFPNLVLKKLIEITTTGSDFHKEGKQVLILTFKAHPPAVVQRRGIGVFSRNVVTVPARQNVKLVYKPSDIELDWRMVGDTKQLQKCLPHLLTPGAGINRLANSHSLFVALNKALKAHPIHGKPQLRLPVYNILPKSPGSNLVPDPAGSLPVGNCYGYIEYLTYLPDCNLQQHEDTSVVPKVNFWTGDINGVPPRSWDFITLDPLVPVHALPLGMNPLDEIKNYYRIFGWYMALGLILNFGDQHTENMFVHKRQPCLIDLEIMFKHRANEIAATMLDYHFNVNNLNPKKDKNVLLAQNRITNRFVLTMGSQAATHMLAGFNEALIWIANNSAVIINWLNGPGMANVFTRYTPRRTNDYTTNMWKVFLYNIEGNVPIPGGYTTRPFTTLKNWDYYNWFYHNTYGMDGRPVFALSDPDHDWACYLNCDAPAYSRRLGSLELINARGRPVRVVDPGPPAGLNISLNAVDGPFSQAPYAELVLPTPAPVPPGHESIILSAKIRGDPGKKISIELLNNTSGLINRPLTGNLNTLANGNNEITVTFGTDGTGADSPPQLHQLKNLIDNTPVISNLINAEIQPNGSHGNTLVNPQARISLGIKYPTLTRILPGHPAHQSFFQFDIDGINPAQNPLQISLDRINAIVNATTNTQIEGNVKPGKLGNPLINAITLDDVIKEFRNTTNAKLPNPSLVNF